MCRGTSSSNPSPSSGESANYRFPEHEELRYRAASWGHADLCSAGQLKERGEVKARGALRHALAATPLDRANNSAFAHDTSSSPYPSPMQRPCNGSRIGVKPQWRNQDQAPLWLFGLTPQSTPPSGSSETASLMLDAKDARCGLGWRKENRPPEWGPRQPSSTRPS